MVTARADSANTTAVTPRRSRLKSRIRKRANLPSLIVAGSGRRVPGAEHSRIRRGVGVLNPVVRQARAGRKIGRLLHRDIADEAVEQRLERVGYVDNNTRGRAVDAARAW